VSEALGVTVVTEEKIDMTLEPVAPSPTASASR
jgi:hypothetical protein